MEPRASERDRPGVPQDPFSAVLAPLGRPVSIVFLVVTAFTFYEVVMRYAFNAPTFWVHETTTALTAGCFAFAGAYCLALDKHIRVVLIYDAVGPHIRRWLDVAISVVGCAACGLMAWAAWGAVAKAFWRPTGEFRLETSGSAWDPATPAIVKAILFAMLCVMCVQFALQAIRHIRRNPDLDTHHGEPGKGIYDDA
ncbi:MAG: TRAP transporter small permease subunit [Dichotomicrobium sp.]